MIFFQALLCLFRIISRIQTRHQSILPIEIMEEMRPPRPALVIIFKEHSDCKQRFSAEEDEFPARLPELLCLEGFQIRSALSAMVILKYQHFKKIFNNQNSENNHNINMLL